MKKLSKISLVLIGGLLLVLPAFFVGCGNKKETNKIELANCSIEYDTEFGGAFVTKTIDEFNELGFVYGDSVDVVFKDSEGESVYQLTDIPYYNGYYTKNNEVLLVGYPGYRWIKLGINNGADLWEVANLQEDFTATITLHEGAKYIDVQVARDIHYFDEREKYPSDQIFANFRSLSGGNLKENIIYRSASPCDNQHGRASYTDALIKKAGVEFIVNLADTDTKIQGYMNNADFNSPYFQGLYQNGKVILLTMNMNFASDTFKTKLVDGLKAIINNNGPFLVHCTEGKDRTGFVCMFLEAFAGASYDQIVEDYMMTYFNYYGIAKGFDSGKYNTIVENLLHPMLDEVIGYEGANYDEVDFASVAENYISDKLTAEQINLLRTKICKSPNPEQTTYEVRFVDYDGSALGVKLSEDDEEVVYVQYVREGESAIAPPVPRRLGYRFKGWNKNFSSVMSDLEIQATYTQVCEVEFWCDNEIYEVTEVDYGRDVQLPLEDPQKIGYRFDHWEGNTKNITSKTIIHAVFVKQYTVKFVGFDGEEITSQAVDENSSAVAPNPPVVEGYTFDHWDKDFSSVTSDMTVSAIYKSSSYSVSFVDYDGRVIDYQRIYQGQSATAPEMEGKIYVDFDATEKKGYQFSGWDKEFSSVTADLVVNAQYQEVTTPIFYIKSETIQKGSGNFVSVSVYVVSSSSFSALALNIEYSNKLDLTKENVSIKNIFNSPNQSNLDVDSRERELHFSWYYSQGEYSLTDNYAKVLEMNFEIDDFVAVGQYEVSILPSSTYVKDSQNNAPITISGYVIVEEV